MWTIDFHVVAKGPADQRMYLSALRHDENDQYGLGVVHWDPDRKKALHFSVRTAAALAEHCSAHHVHVHYGVESQESA